MMDSTESTGLVGLERGKIREKKADSLPNRYVYKVESLTRDGVVSRWMESVNANINEYRGDPPAERKAEYQVGDPVYYFMFADGRGMVLGRIRQDLE